jgi:hypothetical protein
MKPSNSTRGVKWGCGKKKMYCAQVVLRVLHDTVDNVPLTHDIRKVNVKDMSLCEIRIPLRPFFNDVTQVNSSSGQQRGTVGVEKELDGRQLRLASTSSLP